MTRLDNSIINEALSTGCVSTTARDDHRGFLELAVVAKEAVHSEHVEEREDNVDPKKDPKNNANHITKYAVPKVSHELGKDAQAAQDSHGDAKSSSRCSHDGRKVHTRNGSGGERTPRDPSQR